MKVLIIGLGSIATKHIRALKQIENRIEIYALRSGDSSKEIEGVHSIKSIQSIKVTSFDFAIISNPTYLHANTIRLLISSKIPLFIEKPLFASLEDENLIHIIKYESIKTYIACNLRFLDCLQYMKKVISTYRINEVNIYCGSYLPDWRNGIDYKTSYSALTELGGGVDLDLIHEIDYAIWLFGEPQKVTKFSSSNSSLEIQASDNAHYYFNYSKFNVGITLNYYRKDAKRTMEVVCEEGTFCVDLIKNKVNFDNKELVSFSTTILDTYQKQLTFFINEILDGNTVFNDAEEAFKILKICLQKD